MRALVQTLVGISRSAGICAAVTRWRSLSSTVLAAPSRSDYYCFKSQLAVDLDLTRHLCSCRHPQDCSRALYWSCAHSCASCARVRTLQAICTPAVHLAPRKVAGTVCSFFFVLLTKVEFASRALAGSSAAHGERWMHELGVAFVERDKHGRGFLWSVNRLLPSQAGRTHSEALLARFREICECLEIDRHQLSADKEKSR